MKIIRNLKLEVCLILILSCFFCFADAFLKVPQCRQAKSYTCGVAALQCVMAYYGDEIRQDIIEKKVRCNHSVGTKYMNIYKFAVANGFGVEIFQDMTIDDLTGYLDQGKPVLLAIQAWTDNPPVDYTDDWIDGHYVVAIGYDSENLYFMDPSTLGNYTYISIEEFLTRWHDMETRKLKLIHFGMVITKGQPVYNPDEIKHMD